MKKLLATLVIAATLWSCASDDAILPPSNIDRAGVESCKAGARSDTLRAGTWNLAVGFSVSDLFFLNPDSSRIIWDRADKIFQDARSNVPRERIRLVAREIVRSGLEVVGLQEMLRLSRNDTLIANFADTLRADLAALGHNYRLLLRPLNAHVLVLPPGTPGRDTLVMDFAEGQALLVSDRWTVVSEGISPFRNVIPVILPGGIHTTTERAVQWALLRRDDGFQLEVWNTHLEILQGQITGQAGEFLSLSDSLRAAAAFLPSGRLFLGDINNVDGAPADVMLRQGGWQDSWDTLRFGPGYSYGGGKLRDSAKTFVERLDRVMHQGGCAVDSVWRGGIAATQTDSGWLFPSDHALVAAQIRYGIRP